MDRLLSVAAIAMVYLPIALGGGGSPVPPDPLDDFFGLAAVHEVSIEVDEHGIASLLERPRTYVHASVRIGDARYADVGLRLKGGAGSFVPLDGDYPPISATATAGPESRRSSSTSTGTSAASIISASRSSRSTTWSRTRLGSTSTSATRCSARGTFRPAGAATGRSG